MTVVLIGSSGGGTATLGHTDPIELLKTINYELSKVQNSKSKSSIHDSTNNDTIHSTNRIQYGLFLSLHGGQGLDSANPDTTLATLYKQIYTNVIPICTGSLKKVNEMYRKLDKEVIAPMIQSGSITGMICISCDPTNVNSSSLSAAAEKGIAVTGSGGTSLSAAVVMHHGLHLVGNAGGSVATTTHTRAVSYCYALANAWGCDYSPFYNSADADSDSDVDGNATFLDMKKVRPHVRSILDSCIPAFIGVCLASKFVEEFSYDHYSILENAGFGSFIPDSEWRGNLLRNLRGNALPSVCCVVCASAFAPEHKSIVIMAACIASSVCTGSVLGGLLAGWIVSCLVERALFACIRLGIPATMTNILVAGGSGSIVALMLYYTYSIEILIYITDFIRFIVQTNPLHHMMNFVANTAISDLLLQQLPWDGKTGFGFIFGCIFCYGSKVGWYHAFFLPIILIEMEQGRPSLWGAIDECTLVLVSAGICLGNIVCDKIANSSTSLLTKGDVAISKRGLRINILYGDFIEAAYPFMERSWIINYSSYLACGVATEILYRERPEQVLSSAYMPCFLSLWLSNDWQRMGIACIAAFFISFFGSLLGHFWNIPQKSYKHEKEP